MESARVKYSSGIMFHKLSVWGGGERDYQVLQEFASSVGVREEPREIKEWYVKQLV